MQKIFNEIRAELNLMMSLPYKDKNYLYWNKTTTQGNYSIKLRKKIGSEEERKLNGD